MSQLDSEVTAISISTAGGIGEQNDIEIREGLSNISVFISNLHYGTCSPFNFMFIMSYTLQPVVIKNCEEQLEEEGGNEELEAQQINVGYSVIKSFANQYKRWALNYFVDFSNPRP
ncbi:MAG: hypothetical protein EZS28_016634 [Streblomastix strix]|uniref:Uncharacterized protein n=1 Tax=Streblomastix strix TaxID=222440 RepID=A0A5J4VYT7_9EUKA|nr:MAG: hypothetical protein EZS28_016634 [Streblomastix strix]